MEQKKIAGFLIILLLLLISQSFNAQEQGSKKSSSGNSGSGMVYQCENDPGVIANNPGSCSKCGAKLKALTMDEAVDNLSGKSKKKPELKVRKVYSVKKEEPETHESMEVSESIEDSSRESTEVETISTSETAEDTLSNPSRPGRSKEHDAMVTIADLNKDGYVYQCPKCFEQMSDIFDDCEECFRDMEKVTVEEAKKRVPVRSH